MKTHTMAVVAALVLTCGQPATAGDDNSGGTPPGTALYLGAPDAQESADRATQALAGLYPAVTPSSTPQHIGVLAPPGQYAALGVSVVDRCPDVPIDGRDYERLLEEIERTTFAMQDTRPLVAAVMRLQPCLSEPLEPGRLAWLAFHRGVEAFGAGRPGHAREAFREVFAIDAKYPWDPSYPSEAKELFEAVQADMDEQSPAELEIIGPQGASVWIDGRSVDDPTVPTSVAPGRHHVLVNDPTTHKNRSVSVVVAPGAKAAVIHPSAVAPEGVGTPYFEQTIERLFAALDAAPGIDPPGHIVALVSVLHIWSWNSETGTLRRLAGPIPGQAVAVSDPASAEIEDDESKARPPGPSPAFPIMLGAGAAAFVAGTIATGVNQPQYNSMFAAAQAGEIPYPHPSDTDPSSDALANQEELLQYRNNAAVGGALMAVGGVVMVVSVPVAVVTARREHEVSVGATVVGSEGAPQVVHFTLSFTTAPREGR